jgi:disulfide bond formation protein DsbB
MDTISLGTLVLSSLTVIAQASIIILVLLKILRKKKAVRTLLDVFQKHAMLLAFMVALAAMLGSLFYSEIAMLEPCELCWFQRILMYPQTLLLGIALLQKKDDVRAYIIPMCVIGLLLSLYHYSLQVRAMFNPAISCPATGVSCTAGVSFAFGYISIPLMAATAFLFILVSMMLPSRSHKAR